VIDQNQFRGSLLVCDSAQVQGGKLYILGGGWSRVFMFGQALNMALAVRVLVPWHEANIKHKMKIRLLDGDGKPAKPVELPLAPGAVGFEIDGELETGRPPGISQGSFLDSAVALNFQLALAPGQYVWELTINGKALDHYPFEVVSGPLPPAGQPREGT
jgi:hypothetical protein